MKQRILIIEDDSGIARLLRDNLEYEGYDVEWCETGDNAMQKVKKYSPNLVLLDLMLPNDVDGFRICEALAEQPDRTPVIILTARSQRQDRVQGLSMGADDYVTKPFALDELLARIHAVLRRTSPRLGRLRLGDTVIDFRRLRAVRNGQDVVFTDREFEVVRFLAERAGTVVKRDDILRLVWGYSEAPLTRTVDNFIFRLRQKIERDPHHPKYIRTVYGDGYRLNLDE